MSTDSTPHHLAYFVASYVDIQQALASYGVESGGSEALPYHGPIASEIVFNNGSVVKQTNVFKRPDGSTWAGPVHKHNNSYMAGSKHSDSVHDTLEVVKSSNTKLKDMRKQLHPSKKTSQEQKKEPLLASCLSPEKKTGLLVECFLSTWRP